MPNSPADASLLGRYQPLEHILCVDDFDRGFCGWQTYFPDYDGWDDYAGRHPHIDPLSGTVEQSLWDPALRADRRAPIGPRGVPMLSSLSSWDIGTQGAFDGNYALKIPTISKAGYKAAAHKRITCPWRGKFRVETWFLFKAESCDHRLGELDVRSILLTFDVMDGVTGTRWWPAVRYHNAEDGRKIGRWQANFRGGKSVPDGPFDDIEDGQQELGFNRSPTKYQWHYLRFTFDLGRHQYADFHCYGRDFKVAGREHRPEPPLEGWRASVENCPGLINAGFRIEAGRDRRCFLYLDSVVVSASEG